MTDPIPMKRTHIKLIPLKPILCISLSAVKAVFLDGKNKSESRIGVVDFVDKIPLRSEHKYSHRKTRSEEGEPTRAGIWKKKVT